MVMMTLTFSLDGLKPAANFVYTIGFMSSSRLTNHVELYFQYVYIMKVYLTSKFGFLFTCFNKS